MQRNGSKWLCAVKARVRGGKYRVVDREKIRARQAKYHAEHFGEERAYRAANAEKIRVRVEKWRAENPYKVRAQEHRRRLRTLGEQREDVTARLAELDAEYEALISSVTNGATSGNPNRGSKSNAPGPITP
jgi:hypothetical protein